MAAFLRFNLTRIAGFAVALVLSGAGSVRARQPGSPPYLEVYREVLKPGRGGSTHLQFEAGWPAAFRRAKVENYYIALTTSYGPPEAWFVAAHGSLAEIDQLNQLIGNTPGLGARLDRLTRADAVNIQDRTTILLRHRADLSRGRIDAATVRVWELIQFRIRPGHEASFYQSTETIKEAMTNARILAAWDTYEVMAGIPGPTFMVWIGHSSLAEMDANTAAGQAIATAMAGEVGTKLAALAAEGFISTETLVFGVSPEMSYAPPDFVERDKAFWSRRAPPPRP